MDNLFPQYDNNTLTKILTWLNIKQETIKATNKDLIRIVSTYCDRLEGEENESKLKSEIETIFNNPAGRMMLEMSGSSVEEIESLAEKSAAQVAGSLATTARLAFNRELSRQLSETVKADSEEVKAARSEWLKIQIDQMLQRKLGTTVEVLPNPENGKALPAPPKKNSGKTASTHSNPT